MKDGVTYDKYKCPKSRQNKLIFPYHLSKVSGRFELRICGLQDQCLGPLSYTYDVRYTTNSINNKFSKYLKCNIVT